jgi:hypothetical protein
MACPKIIWSSIKFDQVLLKKFHFYDVDFSLKVARASRKVLVSNRIDLVHLTVGGDFGNKWVEQAFIFHEENKTRLPFELERKTDRNEHLLIRYWLDWLKDQPISFSNRLKWTEAKVFCGVVVCDFKIHVLSATGFKIDYTRQSGEVIYKERPVEISICIPFIKRLIFLKRLLESVKSKLSPDYEIIITDDSPDDSIETLVKKTHLYNRSNILKIVRH